LAEKRALICGVTGQDGAYLAQFLLVQGNYRIFGTTRSDPAAGSENLRRLRVDSQVTLHSMEPVDRAGVDAVLRACAPDEIYYLAAQSSVWRSFSEPLDTFRGSVEGLLNVLESARQWAPSARILNAASGDCFGETTAEMPATEASPFRPRSPYAAAKCAGHHALSVARLAYGQFCCSAFLFSHESPLRSEAFAVGRAIAAARRIAEGSDEILEMGNVGVVRDWGWAPDYVEAMWRMLQQPEPDDFVIATGESRSLAELIELIFAARGLDWRDHVHAGTGSPRPADIRCQHADPSKARERLGWTASTRFAQLADKLTA
jgi:GDPmannose 4,6-dehydratase